MSHNLRPPSTQTLPPASPPSHSLLVEIKMEHLGNSEIQSIRPPQPTNRASSDTILPPILHIKFKAEPTHEFKIEHPTSILIILNMKTEPPSSSVVLYLHKRSIFVPSLLEHALIKPKQHDKNIADSPYSVHRYRQHYNPECNPHSPIRVTTHH